jgi:hypothetical protein
MRIHASCDQLVETVTEWLTEDPQEPTSQLGKAPSGQLLGEPIDQHNLFWSE